MKKTIGLMVAATILASASTAGAQYVAQRGIAWKKIGQVDKCEVYEISWNNQQYLMAQRNSSWSTSDCTLIKQ